MGKGRSRRRKQRKTRSKQDVICLPPPQETPVAQNRDQVSDAMAIPLAGSAEELVVDPDALETLPQNRQERRKAARANKKALKRRGRLVSAKEKAPRPEARPVSESKNGVPSPSKGPFEKEAQSTDPQGEVAVTESPESPSINASIAAFAPATEPIPQIDASELAASLFRTETEPEPEGGKIQNKEANSQHHKESASERCPEVEAESEPPWYTTQAKGRAVSDPNERLVPRLRRWMRLLLSKKPQVIIPEPSGPSLDQLIDLKTDLSRVQDRIDMLISSAKR